MRRLRTYDPNRVLYAPLASLTSSFPSLLSYASLPTPVETVATVAAETSTMAAATTAGHPTIAVAPVGAEATATAAAADRQEAARLAGASIMSLVRRPVYGVDRPRSESLQATAGARWSPGMVVPGDRCTPAARRTYSTSALAQTTQSHDTKMDDTAGAAHGTVAAGRAPSGILSLAAVGAAIRACSLPQRQYRSIARAAAERVRHVAGPGCRTFGSLRNDSALHMLLEDAERNRGNARKQYVLYRVLVGTDPAEVIRRYESGQYAADDACAREYVRALALSNELERVSVHVKHAEERAGDGAGTMPMSAPAPTPAQTPVAHATSSSPLEAPGGPDRPLHVVMHQPTMRQQLWRTVRTLLIGLLVISAVSSVLEERGVGGRSLSIHTEYQPDSSSRYTFDDVQGVDEAKDELRELVDFLKDKERFTRLGGKLPKGVLLMGPPGTGKTLLARAVAGEAGVPFFYSTGSEFDEMFVGVGARRVRELFAAAKRAAPCIVFIDEIDAIGSSRNPRDQQYVKMTLNQLLVELDGFNTSDGVVVIGATNFPESLDKALVRPGRFDRQIVVPMPDVRGRTDILKTHTKKVPLAPDVDLSVIARGTPGFSGAELANLINQAAIKASVDNAPAVSMTYLEWAKDKILMGAERKSAVIEEENRRLIAYHESGHALVAVYSDGAMPVHKATIMPRGKALGMVTQLPEKDELNWSRRQLVARLNVCMGGRVAEELIFGSQNITSGASSDLEQATAIARTMVTKYGMSEALGLVAVRDDDVQLLSSETRLLIETETKRLAQAAYEQARNIIREHEPELHRLAAALLQYETLTASEIRAVLRNEPLPAPAH